MNYDENQKEVVTFVFHREREREREREKYSQVKKYICQKTTEALRLHLQKKA